MLFGGFQIYDIQPCNISILEPKSPILFEFDSQNVLDTWNNIYKGASLKKFNQMKEI